MATVHFEATVEREDEGTFVEVPLDVPAVFGRARPPVRVTCNDHTWHSTVAVYGSRYCLPLRAKRPATRARRAAKTLEHLRGDR